MRLKTFIESQKRKEHLKEEFIKLVEQLQKLEEKSVSQAQQKAAGAALSAKRGETPVSELKGASKQMYDSMSEKELEDYASTKHKGLPKKVEEGSKKRKSKKNPTTKIPDPEKRVIGNPKAAGEMGKYKKDQKYKRRKEKQKGYDNED